MRDAFLLVRRYGLDCLTFVVLCTAAYIFSRPLRERWTRHRQDVAAARAARREWDGLKAVASALNNDTATTQVVEISDYECPFCRKTSAAVDSAVKSGLRVSYLNYPLPIHPQAEGAALAAICAESAGRFREMHARLMSTSIWQRDSNWTREASAAGVEDLRAFGECMKGTAAMRRLSRERALADSIGVQGTPLFVSRETIHRGVASSADLLALERRR
jgi:protein-disulfide isomerase